MLGVGPSAREVVEGFHGICGYDRPLARLREAIEVIRLLIAKSHTGEPTRYDGEFYRHDWTKYQGNHFPPLRTEIPSGSLPRRGARPAGREGGRRVDSFLLVPPFLEVPLDRLMNYTFALADTFYA